MDEIFASYASAYRAKVAPLTDIFIRVGWSILLDSTIEAGERWREVIALRLAGTNCHV
jgi:hypothetical protein